MSHHCVSLISNNDFETLLSVSFAYHDDGGFPGTARQMHIFKARELIFTESRLIATPVLRRPYSVLAVMKRELLDSDSFSDLLQGLELVVTSACHVTPEDYQACMTYTIGANLAPAWNQVGRYFCEGRDFLVETGPLSAIEWELFVTERQSELVVTAFAIQLEQMTLSYLLGVPEVGPVLQQRLNFGEVSIRPLICYVLPSMKTACAIAVSLAPFPGCEYSSFQNLRLYWEKTYGYHIPEDLESTMSYVKVCFKGDTTRFYTYPILCVRPKPLGPVAHINPRSTIDKFMEYVKLKMAKLLNTTARGPAYPTAALHWTAKDSEVRMDAVSCTRRPSCGRVPSRTGVSFETRLTANVIGDVRTNVGGREGGRNVPLNKPLVPASTTVPWFQPSEDLFDVTGVAAGRNLGSPATLNSNPPHSCRIQLGETHTTAPKLTEQLLRDTFAKELPRGDSERYQPAAASRSKPEHSWPTRLGEKKAAPEEWPLPEGPRGCPERDQPTVAPGSKPPPSLLTWSGEKRTAPEEWPLPDEPPAKDLPRAHSGRDQPALASNAKPPHCWPTRLGEKKPKSAERPLPDEPPAKEMPRGRSGRDQLAVASNTKPKHSRLAEKETASAERLIPDKPPPKELLCRRFMHNQSPFTSSVETQDSWRTPLRSRSRSSERSSAKAEKWQMLNNPQAKEMQRGRFGCGQPTLKFEGNLPYPLKEQESPHSKVLKWLNSIELPTKKSPHGHSEGHHPAVAACDDKHKGNRPTTLKEHALPKAVKWQLHCNEPSQNNPPCRRPKRGQPTYAEMMTQQQLQASLNEFETPQRSTASTAAWQSDDFSRKQSLRSAMFSSCSATITHSAQQACEQPVDTLNMHGALPKMDPAFNSAHVVRQHQQEPRTTQWPHNDRHAPRQHSATEMKQSGSVPAALSSIPKVTLSHSASPQKADIASTTDNVRAHSARREMASSSHTSKVDQKAAAARMRSTLSPVGSTLHKGHTTVTGRQESSHGYSTISEVDRLIKEKEFDKLHSVSTAVLHAWLCAKKIPCSIKDTRANILFKVTQHAAN